MKRIPLQLFVLLIVIFFVTISYADEITGQVVSLKVGIRSYTTYFTVETNEGTEIDLQFSAYNDESWGKLAYANLMAAFINDVDVIVDYNYQTGGGYNLARSIELVK
jgi:hypothetical protein